MSEESAVEAWLNREGTRAEIAAAILHFRRYNPSGGGKVVDTITEFQATMFALCIELLATLEMYVGDDPDPTIEGEMPLDGFDPALEDDDEDDDRPWLRRA